MSKFCRYCGSPIPENANFCRSCGRSLAAPGAQPSAANQTSPHAPGGNSEREQRENPQQSVWTQPTKAASSGKKAHRQTSEHTQSPFAGKKKAEASYQGPSAPQLRELAASASAGEMDFEAFGLSVPGGITEPLGTVLSPLSGLLHSIGDYFGGIICVFRNPVSIIGTIVMAVLWYVLTGLRGSDSELVRALSWLTFAGGGLDRSLPGMVGGVLGKGTVAAALLSLVNGGLVNAVKGVGALFTGHGEKRSIPSVVIGAFIGAAFYIAFSGTRPSTETAMAGIAGALLSLEALGGGKGKLYELVQSLTSRAADGVRTAVRGKCDGLLTGLTLGFALAAVVSVLL